jgi:hypothetical protein
MTVRLEERKKLGDRKKGEDGGGFYWEGEPMRRKSTIPGSEMREEVLSRNQ